MVHVWWSTGGQRNPIFSGGGGGGDGGTDFPPLGLGDDDGGNYFASAEAAPAAPGTDETADPFQLGPFAHPPRPPQVLQPQERLIFLRQVLQNPFVNEMYERSACRLIICEFHKLLRSNGIDKDKTLFAM